MSSNSTLPAGFAEGSWWYYAPSKIAPVIFAVLFLISCSWHLYQNIVYKSWKSTALLPLAPAFFVVGYAFREVGAFYYTQIGWFMASSILLLCSPPVFEAANWFVLSRLFYYVPYKAPLHPFRLIITFAGFQTICDSITSNGASKATTPFGGHANQESGTILMQVSIAMQLLSITAFTLITLRFEYNCRMAGIFPAKLRRPLRILYVSCALLSLRTIYRAVEWYETAHLGSSTPNDASDPYSFAPVLRHEVFFWMFEASPMLVNSFLLNILHPTKCLPVNYKVYLAPDGMTEVEGRGLTKDPRVWWLQLLDPFDLYGLFTNRDRDFNIWAPEENAKAASSKEAKDDSASTSEATESDAASEMEKLGWGRWNTQDQLVRVV